MDADESLSTLGLGARIMELPLLLSKLEHNVVCKACAMARQEQELYEFALWYDDLLPRRMRPREDARPEDMPVVRPLPADAVKLFRLARNGGGRSVRTVPGFKLTRESQFGLASELCFECSGLSRLDNSTDVRPGSGNTHRFTLHTSPRVKDSAVRGSAAWAVNQRAALAALQSGQTAGDFFSILTVLGIPMSPHFVFRGQSAWRSSEVAVGKAMNAVAWESCNESLREEVELTIAAKKKALVEMAGEGLRAVEGGACHCAAAAFHQATRRASAKQQRRRRTQSSSPAWGSREETWSPCGT